MVYNSVAQLGHGDTQQANRSAQKGKTSAAQSKQLDIAEHLHRKTLLCNKARLYLARQVVLHSRATMHNKTISILENLVRLLRRTARQTEFKVRQ